MLSKEQVVSSPSSSATAGAPQKNSCSHLETGDPDPVLDGLEQLLAGLAGPAAEDELGVEGPALGQAPLGADLVVDEGVVVLQAGAEALELEGGPGDELLHAEALGGEVGELGGVGGKPLLHLAGALLVVEEEDGAGAGAEPPDAGRRGLPPGVGHDGAQGGEDDVPEAVVLGAEEDEGPVGLDVEGGRGVEGGLADDVPDPVGGDGAQVLVQGVDCPARLDGVQEGLG